LRHKPQHRRAHLLRFRRKRGETTSSIEEEVKRLQAPGYGHASSLLIRGSKNQEGGTRMCHAWQCAVCTARNDAAHPRPVIVSIGAVAGGLSLSEAARPMACGFVRSPRIPCASSRLFMFSGLLLRFAQPRDGDSRSITSLVALGEHWPTALQRSDGRSLMALARCRIDFHAMLGRRGVWATKAG
jgi:hypothetical protein